MLINLSDLFLPKQESINHEKVKIIHDSSPRRICFSSTHSNALKRENGTRWIGKFSVPFSDTIKPIFEKETGLNLYYKEEFDNYWYSIRTEKEFEKIQNFIQKYYNVVFIKDTLALSIALGENIKDSKTQIGELETKAKYGQDYNARKKLSELCINFISITPFYKNTKIICAIPSSDNSSESLPRYITNLVASNLNLNDISNNIMWKNNKQAAKELPFEKKWEALENANLIVNINLNKKTIILLDDLYQSGTTIQYVAMKLLAAGAKRIYGLTIVKSRRDTDNI